jgi:hypothetical protein
MGSLYLVVQLLNPDSIKRGLGTGGQMCMDKGGGTQGGEGAPVAVRVPIC